VELTFPLLPPSGIRELINLMRADIDFLKTEIDFLNLMVDDLKTDADV